MTSSLRNLSLNPGSMSSDFCIIFGRSSRLIFDEAPITDESQMFRMMQLTDLNPYNESYYPMTYLVHCLHMKKYILDLTFTTFSSLEWERR